MQPNALIYFLTGTSVLERTDCSFRFSQETILQFCVTERRFIRIGAGMRYKTQLSRYNYKACS